MFLGIRAFAGEDPLSSSLLPLWWFYLDSLSRIHSGVRDEALCFAKHTGLCAAYIGYCPSIA